MVALKARACFCVEAEEGRRRNRSPCTLCVCVCVNRSLPSMPLRKLHFCALLRCSQHHIRPDLSVYFLNMCGVVAVVVVALCTACSGRYHSSRGAPPPRYGGPPPPHFDSRGPPPPSGIDIALGDFDRLLSELRAFPDKVSWTNLFFDKSKHVATTGTRSDFRGILDFVCNAVFLESNHNLHYACRGQYCLCTGRAGTPWIEPLTSVVFSLAHF